MRLVHCCQLHKSLEISVIRDKQIWTLPYFLKNVYAHPRMTSAQLGSKFCPSVITVLKWFLTKNAVTVLFSRWCKKPADQQSMLRVLYIFHNHFSCTFSEKQNDYLTIQETNTQQICMPSSSSKLICLCMYSSFTIRCKCWPWFIIIYTHTALFVWTTVFYH